MLLVMTMAVPTEAQALPHYRSTVLRAMGCITYRLLGAMHITRRRSCHERMIIRREQCT